MRHEEIQSYISHMKLKVSRNCFCGDSNVALGRKKKTFKVAIINIFWELNESMPKEIEEDMTLSYQDEGIKKDRNSF